LFSYKHLNLPFKEKYAMKKKETSDGQSRKEDEKHGNYCPSQSFM
jgi:hypothetical protein